MAGKPTTGTESVTTAARMHDDDEDGPSALKRPRLSPRGAFSVFSAVRCPDGEFFAVHVSALSKFMRRRQAEEAEYAAMQLYLCGFQEATEVTDITSRKNFRTRAVNRFAVACLEDTVPACPWVLVQLESISTGMRASFSAGRVDAGVADLVCELVGSLCSTVAGSPLGAKSRFMQHVRELQFDPWVVAIEAATRPNAQLALFEGRQAEERHADPEWAPAVLSAAKAIFMQEKKSIILVAAAVSVKYARLSGEADEATWRPAAPDHGRGAARIARTEAVAAAGGSRARLLQCPWIFDKHVGAGLRPAVFQRGGARQTELPVGWPGFVAHEEAACSSRESSLVAGDSLVQRLKAEYAVQRCSFLKKEPKSSFSQK